MEVISVALQKGGTAKTTTTQNLGAGLHKRGYKVLYIDLDGQGSLTYALGVKTPQKTIYEALKGIVSVQETIYATEQGDLIPASEHLAMLDNELTKTGREYKLKELLEPIKEKYDFILIDTPPALNVLSLNALTVSDSLIIPLQADIFSLQGLGQLYESIYAIKRYTNPKLTVKGFLLSRYNARSILTKDLTQIIEDTARQYGTKLFKTKIRECIAVKEAQLMKKNIFDYAPNSNASKDFEKFIEEVLEK
jgi:chromosome partitioning protein